MLVISVASGDATRLHSEARRAPDGRENVLAVMGPSDQFGELSVFDPGPRTATATAVTDVRMARMPQSERVRRALLLECEGCLPPDELQRNLYNSLASLRGDMEFYVLEILALTRLLVEGL